MIPTVTTDRLILRGARRDDFDAFADMLAADRTAYMGGPFDRAAAWRLFAMNLASWPLDGFGAWMITDRTTGAFLGDVGITHPIRFPEPELGWTLTGDAEGQGYATEAASAALDWYWTNTDADTVVSYITPGNTRSEALASKLGATLGPDAPLPDGETPAETAVYRHGRPA
ncbi:GNAT family N-acetyltransferase [uncultured Tateyamaria sp.]|uniref:GNAT family N-acetyltransferase n=1 Tax=uncultured Tateyamaria sp. TaxID=455651 RepID=UPI00262B960A|nr:GNAT family N-acetyltransferase [uncultured Tateyamaria sp.]